MSGNIVAGSLVAAILVIGGMLAARTFLTNGKEAVDRMSSDERAFLIKLQSLRRGMRWNVGGNPLNGVAVYIYPAGADHFTWISIGRFTYEGKLRPSKALERTREQPGPRLTAASAMWPAARLGR